MQLTGWGCGKARKIIRLFELPLPVADALAFGGKSKPHEKRGLRLFN